MQGVERKCASVATGGSQLSRRALLATGACAVPYALGLGRDGWAEETSDSHASDAGYSGGVATGNAAANRGGIGNA